MKPELLADRNRLGRLLVALAVFERSEARHPDEHQRKTSPLARYGRVEDCLDTALVLSHHLTELEDFRTSERPGRVTVPF